MRRRLIGALAALAVLAGVALGSAYFTLTSTRFERLFRDRLEHEIEHLGRGALRVGSLQLEPLALRATLVDLEAHVDGANSSFAAKRVIAHLDPWSLVLGRLVIGKLELVAADLVVDLREELGLGELFSGDHSRRRTLDMLSLTRTRLELVAATGRTVLTELDATVDLGGDAVSLSTALSLADLTIDGKQLAPGRARLELDLTDTALHIRTLDAELRTGPIRIDGRIDTATDTLDLGVTAELDLTGLFHALGRHGAMGGNAAVDGTVVGTFDSAELRGTIEIPALIAADRLIARRVFGDVIVGRSGLALETATADIAGGTARFRADVPFQGDGEARVALNAEQLSVDELLTLIPKMPMGGGIVSGEAELWIPYHGEMRVDARPQFSGVDPHLRSSVRDPTLELMLADWSGSGRVRYADGVLELSDSWLQGTWGNGTIAGRFPAEGPVEACIEVYDADFGAISTLPGPELPWLTSVPEYRIEGPARAEVSWTGTLDQPVFEVDAAVAGATIVGALTGQTTERSVLAAGVLHLDYRDDVVRWRAATGRMERGSGGAERPGSEPSLSARGTVRLTELASTQSVAVRMEHWDALALARLGGIANNITGDVDVDAALQFDGREWTSVYRVVGSGSVDGWPLEEVDSTIHFDRTGFEIERWSARIGDATTRAIGHVRTDNVALELELDDLPLTSLLEDPPVDIAGALSLRIRVDGTRRQWRAAGELTIDDLRIMTSDFGQVWGSVEATPHNVHLQLVTESESDLWADIVPESPLPFRATASFQDLQLEPLVEMLGPKMDLALGGEATGALVFTGKLDSERPIEKATLEITSSRLTVPGYRVRSEGTWRFTARRDGSLHLSDLVLADQDRRLSIAGTLGRGEQPWDLQLSGTTDLQLVRALVAELYLSGPVSIDARLTGTSGRLSLDGTAELKDGYLRSAALPYPLREVQADVDLDGRIIRVPRLDARFGGGNLSADAVLDLDARDGPRLLVRALGEDVRFTLFEDLEVRADPDLIYEVTSTSKRLAGTLHVARAVYELRSDFLASDRLAPGVASSEALRGFPETNLDLRVVAPSNVWLTADWLKLEGDAELRISGSTSEPTVLGSVRYLAQERLELDGRVYHVAHGTLTFDNPAIIDPGHRLRGVELGAGL